jgi:hypothetical protein
VPIPDAAAARGALAVKLAKRFLAAPNKCWRNKSRRGTKETKKQNPKRVSGARSRQGNLAQGQTEDMKTFMLGAAIVLTVVSSAVAQPLPPNFPRGVRPPGTPGLVEQIVREENIRRAREAEEATQRKIQRERERERQMREAEAARQREAEEEAERAKLAGTPTMAKSKMLPFPDSRQVPDDYDECKGISEGNPEFAQP